MRFSIIEKLKQCFDEIPENDNRSKIFPKEFITTLILNFTRDTHRRTLAGLRRNLINSTNKVIARSTFWKRLGTRRLSVILSQLIGRLIAESAKNLCVPNTLLEKLGVEGIFLLDSTSITLPKNAKKDFPATRIAPAAIKWHSLWDLTVGQLKWFELTAGTEHDSKYFPKFATLKNKLIIFDLGYFNLNMFQELSKQSYFLSRLRGHIRAEFYQIVSGLPRKFEGTKLYLETLPKRENIIDALVLLGENGDFIERVVGFWDFQENKYHWYVTNLSVDAELIYPLYRLRWQLELVYKSVKSSMRMADIGSSDKSIILNFQLISIAAILLTTSLRQTMNSELVDSQRLAVSSQRLAILMVHLGKLFQNYFLGKQQALAQLKQKVKLFINEVFDPNLGHRDTSLMKVFKMIQYQT